MARRRRRVLKDTGTLWVIGSYHNIFRVGAILQDLGFWILNDVVWRKSNPMPNFKGRRFTNAHETLIWATKNPKQQYTFNYEAMKALNDELQMRSDWTCRSAPATSAQGRRRPEGAFDPEAGIAAAPGDRVLAPSRAMWSWIPSSARAPPARWPSGWAATSSASSARRPMPMWRAPASPKSIRRRRAKRSKSPNPSAPNRAFPSAGWWSAACCRRAPCCTAPASTRPPRCAPTAPWSAADASGSIHQIGAHVQGLDACNGWTFWQFETQRRAGADRRAAPAAAGRACLSDDRGRTLRIVIASRAPRSCASPWAAPPRRASAQRIQSPLRIRRRARRNVRGT